PHRACAKVMASSAVGQSWRDTEGTGRPAPAIGFAGLPKHRVSMPRFVVRHQHSPESCPASDPAMGAMLLNHLSPPARYGVVIQGEAVVRGAHTLFFIAEAADETGLRLFLTPLREAGEVEVLAASTYAEVVASGGCDARPPPVLAASIAPADACQD